MFGVPIFEWFPQRVSCSRPQYKSISEILTQDVAVIGPTENLQQAAQRMKDWNIGALPVCDGKRLVGMITDRDIAIRARGSFFLSELHVLLQATKACMH